MERRVIIVSIEGPPRGPEIQGLQNSPKLCAE